jgi:hypothetical protein
VPVFVSADGATELDEEINIAVLSTFFASERAKQRVVSSN